MSAESAHHLAMKSLKSMDSVPGLKAWLNSVSKDPVFDQEIEVFGLKFRNPVGLAAGFDKDAMYVDQLAKLGFGSIEIGTLTPVGQAGNPKPRLFRVPGDNALINRMGFNNQGIEAAVSRLKRRRSRLIIGGNIGKNKVTPNQEALLDYEKCFDALFPVVDYFTINVSSPNTPGLRELQERPFLSKLFDSLQSRMEDKDPKPILLKIAPDLTDEQIREMVSLSIDKGIQGIIATNTTIERNLPSISKEEIEKIGAGGLSGAPLLERSTRIVEQIKKQAGDEIEVIASGGIFTADHVRQKMDAGAKLVQVYTGFIYQGPFFIKNLLKN